MPLAEAARNLYAVRTERAGKLTDFTLWNTHLEIASPRDLQTLITLANARATPPHAAGTAVWMPECNVPLDYVAAHAERSRLPARPPCAIHRIPSHAAYNPRICRARDRRQRPHMTRTHAPTRSDATARPRPEPRTSTTTRSAIDGGNLVSIAAGRRVRRAKPVICGLQRELCQ